MKPKVTCIVPAYNEASRIANVLKAVQHHPWIDQVIVVNDGSSDNTAVVARTFKGVRVISLRRNSGKSHAVKTGIEASRNDIIMLLDADLVGLTHEDLTRLMQPVVEGAVDVTFSLRSSALLVCRMIGIDYITGDRVFSKPALGGLGALDHLQGYGLEVFFNEQILTKGLKIRVVKWKHVISLRKRDKISFLKALWLQTAMVIQILRTVGLGRAISQNWMLLRSSKR